MAARILATRMDHGDEALARDDLDFAMAHFHTAPRWPSGNSDWAANTATAAPSARAAAGEAAHRLVTCPTARCRLVGEMEKAKPASLYRARTQLILLPMSARETGTITSLAQSFSSATAPIL
jgi:hypothetical protein